MIGRGPRATGKTNLFLTKFNLHQVAWQLAARAPQIDLEGQSVLPRAAVEHPLQRRVGDEAAVPIEFPIDLCSRKAGRQGAAGHHMLRANLVGGVVEIDEVAAANVHGADAETSSPGVYQVEIHQAFERALDTASIPA